MVQERPMPKGKFTVVMANLTGAKKTTEYPCETLDEAQRIAAINDTFLFIKETDTMHYWTLDAGAPKKLVPKDAANMLRRLQNSMEQTKVCPSDCECHTTGK